ncbi:MAG: LysR family transcriptional regulator [Lachnospiraceae bacterium]|nr:LysR family transcriptional regulator [Lachnospiraceae bacterium]MCM1230958.1 LysR family transcriptional regulator [Ruminococcus flavefaciens]
MEIRVLRYFLTVAREENITRAAEKLHITQPTLSRQLKQLEDELGKKLFKRGNYSVHLTNEGMLLRKRAEDILSMVDKTAEEFRNLDEITGGDVYIGCAESWQIRYLARKIGELRRKYSGLRYHITSGNTEQVAERLDRGLIDFAVICEPPNLSRYNYIELPEADIWGVVMKKDDVLAEKAEIRYDDLIDRPIICSAQGIEYDISRWCGEKTEKLNLSGTFNLAYNGSVFVREGLGLMLAFDKLLNTGKDSGLVFRPLAPRLETKLYVIWKKYQVFSPMTEKLIELIQDL